MEIVSTRIIQRVVARARSPGGSVPPLGAVPPIMPPVVVVGVKGDKGEPGDDGAPALPMDPGDLTLSFENGLI